MPVDRARRGPAEPDDACRLSRLRSGDGHRAGPVGRGTTNDVGPASSQPDRSQPARPDTARPDTASTTSLKRYSAAVRHTVGWARRHVSSRATADRCLDGPCLLHNSPPRRAPVRTESRRSERRTGSHSAAAAPAPGDSQLLARLSVKGVARGRTCTATNGGASTAGVPPVFTRRPVDPARSGCATPARATPGGAAGSRSSAPTALRAAPSRARRPRSPRRSPSRRRAA